MVSGHRGSHALRPGRVFGAALFLLLVGFARPEAKFNEAKEGATVVLMVDTSGSMARKRRPPDPASRRRRLRSRSS